MPKMWETRALFYGRIETLAASQSSSFYGDRPYANFLIGSGRGGGGKLVGLRQVIFFDNADRREEV